MTDSDPHCPACDSSATVELGEYITKYYPDDTKYRCTFCGNGFSGEETSGSVPIEELEALVEEWRESEEHMASQGVDEWADGIKECADELQEIIDRYE